AASANFRQASAGSVGTQVWQLWWPHRRQRLQKVRRDLQRSATPQGPADDGDWSSDFSARDIDYVCHVQLAERHSLRILRSDSHWRRPDVWRSHRTAVWKEGLTGESNANYHSPAVPLVAHWRV